jgi:hypothetical protein
MSQKFKAVRDVVDIEKRNHEKVQRERGERVEIVTSRVLPFWCT